MIQQVEYGVKETDIIIVDIKTIMDQKKVSVNELSVKTGIRHHIVKKYYNGNIYRPDLYTLKKFCEYLKCEPSDIIKVIARN